MQRQDVYNLRFSDRIWKSFTTWFCERMFTKDFSVFSKANIGSSIGPWLYNRWKIQICCASSSLLQLLSAFLFWKWSIIFTVCGQRFFLFCFSLSLEIIFKVILVNSVRFLKMLSARWYSSILTISYADQRWIF